MKQAPPTQVWIWVGLASAHRFCAACISPLPRCRSNSVVWMPPSGGRATGASCNCRSACTCSSRRRTVSMLSQASEFSSKRSVAPLLIASSAPRLLSPPNPLFVGSESRLQACRSQTVSTALRSCAELKLSMTMTCPGKLSPTDRDRFISMTS